MSNTSARSGYLAPTNAGISRSDLEDVLQTVVVGITGLPGQLVRPRYQPRPPHRPDQDTTWCAVGAAAFPATSRTTTHDSDADGQDVVVTTRSIDVLVSAYGLQALEVVSRLADGLLVGQNRDELRRNGLVVTDIGEPLHAPELIGGVWEDRYDLTISMQWETRRSYGVLNILDAPGGIIADTGSVRTLQPLDQGQE